MDIEKKIAALVALGVDGVRAATIPPAVAQECARRWLVDAARDAERAKVRAIEEAAATEARAHLDAALVELTRTPEAIERLERMERERADRYLNDLAFETWRNDLPPFKFKMSDHVADDYEIDVYPDEGWHGRENYASRRAIREAYDRGEHDVAAALLRDRATVSLARSRDNINHEKRLWRDAIDERIEERAAALGIEWTAALLSATVAMPDGTRVEWGEATREQHAARLEMLSKHAATELETATRHRAAIEALDAAGARCLNDLASVTA